MADFKSKQASSALIGIYSLLMTVFILAVLYFGQDIIIPLSLAILLTFLLSPIVTYFERWIGRLAAVLAVVVIIFISVSFTTYILSREFIDLTSKLPSYKGNIIAKFQSLSLFQNKFFSDFWSKIQTSPGSVLPDKLAILPKFTETAQSVIGALMHIMVNSGFVLLLVIFMLLSREDLTQRIIRLVGKGRNKATEIALNDAGGRISHYLIMQLIINLCFGVALTIGLYFIGIPNAVLWGVLLVVLRFIPYLGTWISAAIPVALSFVISPSWITPIFTIGIYLIIDLLCTNFLEPWLYGVSTGISSTALIIAAVFWTLLWGPIGLLLAIPLTVCLVVLGRHVPHLEFLEILLGDNKESGEQDEFYNKLLNENQAESLVLMEKHLKENSVISFYDKILIPTIIKIENELASGSVDSEKAKFLYQNMAEIVEDLADVSQNAPSEGRADISQTSPSSSKNHILCMPVRTALRDEMAGEILTQLLRQQLYSCENVSGKLNNAKISELVKINLPSVIFITAVHPSTLLHVKFLCNKIGPIHPTYKLIVCLFGVKKTEEDEKELVSMGVDAVVTSFDEAILKMQNINNILINNEGLKSLGS